MKHFNKERWGKIRDIWVTFKIQIIILLFIHLLLVECQLVQWNFFILTDESTRYSQQPWKIWALTKKQVVFIFNLAFSLMARLKIILYWCWAETFTKHYCSVHISYINTHEKLINSLYWSRFMWTDEHFRLYFLTKETLFCGLQYMRNSPFPIMIIFEETNWSSMTSILSYNPFIIFLKGTYKIFGIWPYRQI